MSSPTKEALEFRNGTDLKFSDISSEQYREYVFTRKDGSYLVRIDQPCQLNVSDNGHRIWDASGTSHYVPKGWIHLRWRVKEGQPHFVK